MKILVIGRLFWGMVPEVAIGLERIHQFDAPWKEQCMRVQNRVMKNAKATHEHSLLFPVILNWLPKSGINCRFDINLQLCAPDCEGEGDLGVSKTVL